MQEEGDDYFVFLLSDANLAQYGVSAHTLAAALLGDEGTRHHGGDYSPEERRKDDARYQVHEGSRLPRVTMEGEGRRIAGFKDSNATLPLCSRVFFIPENAPDLRIAATYSLQFSRIRAR